MIVFTVVSFVAKIHKGQSKVIHLPFNIKDALIGMSSTKLNFKVIVNRLILFIGLGVLAHIIFVLSTTEKVCWYILPD